MGGQIPEFVSGSSGGPTVALCDLVAEVECPLAIPKSSEWSPGWRFWEVAADGNLPLMRRAMELLVDVWRTLLLPEVVF